LALIALARLALAALDLLILAALDLLAAVGFPRAAEISGGGVAVAVTSAMETCSAALVACTAEAAAISCEGAIDSRTLERNTG